MRFSFAAGLAAASAVALAAGGACADTFVLGNTTHPERYGSSLPVQVDGNGTAVPVVGGGWLLTGPNTYEPVPNTTTFVATALQAEVLTFNWTYTSFDSSTTDYDPAGYILDGVKTQASVSAPSFFHSAPQSGTVTFNLLAGQTYGFYVASTDSHEGAGQIAFALAAVPEPATWAMMIAGFGLVGMGLRRRRVFSAS